MSEKWRYEIRLRRLARVTNGGAGWCTCPKSAVLGPCAKKLSGSENAVAEDPMDRQGIDAPSIFSRPTVLLLLATAALSVPLSFGRLYGYELNPAYLLTPAIAWAYFKNISDTLNVLFATVAVGGLISTLVANMIDPGHLLDNGVNLILEGLFAPSFLFLGRHLASRFSYQRLSFWLAVASSVFLVVCVVPLLITGAPVRALNPDGTAFLNVSFFGLPIFATFGINSLAPIFCIQSAIIAGAFYRAPRPLQAVFALAIVSGVFLATGSESRSAVLSVLLLVPAAIICFLPKLRLSALATVTILVSIFVAVAMAQFGLPQERLAESISTIGHMVSDDGQKATAASPTEDQDSVDQLTTGRNFVWSAAFNEWRASPIIGNGYSGFGRFAGNVENIPMSVRENTTAHNFFLNALWKGGLLYAVPLFAFILLAYYQASLPHPYTPERIFGIFGATMIFAVASQFWDILIIPSAGAMAWFVLGALGPYRTMSPKPSTAGFRE